jgi:predicted nucleotide-binding protein
LDLNLIILHEQPNKGRTIIEKFQDYSDVAFAIVLLTADDRGGIADSQYDSQSLRARQNVIFELGYFIGKLGRNRVCALYSEGVEIPSDYSGVLFIKFDEAGAWRLAVAKEIKAAGIDIDMNKAL